MAQSLTWVELTAVATEFLDDGGDFAGGDALDIHFGHGEFERLLGADAFFQGAGIEGRFAPDLRDAEGDGADAAGEGLGFVAVGVALAGVGAFVGLGLEDLMTFDAHRFVDEDAEAFGEAGVALVGQELQDVVQEIRIGVVGHVGLCVGCVCDTPTGNQCGPPSTSFPRAERCFTPPGFGSARRPKWNLNERKTFSVKKLAEEYAGGIEERFEALPIV